MPTCRLPASVTFCDGAWPCTSADGLSTRSSSAGSAKLAPSSKSISSRRSARFTPDLDRPGPAPLAGHRRGPRAGCTRLVQRPRLLDQHDRDAVADRVGEAGLLADQLVAHRGRSAAAPWSAGRPEARAGAGRGPPRRSGSLTVHLSSARSMAQGRAAGLGHGLHLHQRHQQPRLAPRSAASSSACFSSGSNGQIMHKEVTSPAERCGLDRAPVGLDAVAVEIGPQHRQQAGLQARPAAAPAAGRRASARSRPSTWR